MPKIPEEVYLELKEYCSRLAGKGYVSAHGGNASIRSGDFMWITRHASPFEDLTPEDIVQVDVTGSSSFDANASIETVVHRQIYLETRNLAVLHAHPPNTVALSFFHNEITPIDTESHYQLKKIPVVEGSPGTQELAKVVVEAMKSNCAVAVRAHGVFASAKHMDAAYHSICMVEHAAHIIYLTENLRRARLKFIKPKKF